MSGIFLSYSRVDRPIAQTIAEALQAEGFKVWWDKVLRAGQTYDEVTEDMLRNSTVVVVLWSETSVKSKWVRAEATLGQRSAELIPAMIADVDRPIMFELTQSADLINWNGDTSDPRWQNLVKDIRAALDREAAANPPAAAPAAPVAPAAPAAKSDDATIETVFWTSVKDGSNPADFEAYLIRYPEGHYSALAKNRLAALKATQKTSEPTSALLRAGADTPPPKKKSPIGIIAVAGLALVAAAAWGATTVMGGPKTGGEPEVATTEPEIETTEVEVPAELPEPEAEAEPVIEAPAEPEAPACDYCPKLVDLPGGPFTIGSPDGEDGRTGNEGPQTEITLPAFSMGETEVTTDQWAACVADGACIARDTTPGLPVSSVSWDDAQGYVRWLSSKTGRRYRLPSESEWEYAARAGTTTRYWWGNRFDGSIVPLGRARPVDTLALNPYGLAGMLGNVREWVQDCYVNNYNAIPKNGDPVTQGDCQLRVVRGGTWDNTPAQHRSANRARITKTVRDSGVGFRVVAEAE